MKSNQEKDKLYIGIVKFFDEDKDFGFIASNNCNMDTPTYSHDFYVNASSFIESFTRTEGKVVVFQIGYYGRNFRTKAINVRCISKSEEDINLALQYYGEHEYFFIKDKVKINLYKSYPIPIMHMIKMLKGIIENKVHRSPRNTIKHFDFFFQHLNTQSKNEILEPSIVLSSAEDSLWMDLLSVFTKKELLLLFNNYPYIIRYCQETELIILWLEKFIPENSSIFNLQELEKTCDYLPRECADYAKKRIEDIVEPSIKKCLHELSLRSDIVESELFPPDTNREREARQSLRHACKGNTVTELWSYLRLTTRNYSREKAECIISVKKNRIKKELNEFMSNPMPRDWRNSSFFTYLNSLPENEIKQYEDEIKESVSTTLDFYFKNDEKNLEYVTNTICNLYENKFINKDFLLSYEQKLLSLATKILSDYLQRNNRNSLQRKNFYDYFHSLTALHERFYIDVINNLPSTVIEGVINTISLNSFHSFDKKYYRPVLVDEILSEVLKNTSIDLVPLIANRLLKFNLYNEVSFSLAIHLTELMTYNKPKEEDGNTNSIWSEKFKSKLELLKKDSPSNLRLSAILWAVHFQSSTSMSALAEVFADLPPYIQIQSVKKIFQLISQGKIRHTATSLYDVISKGRKKICLPLEIAFSYLKLREGTPTATFNNNHMVQLIIISEREDYSEWINICYLMTNCSGRWKIKNGTDNSFNNLLNSIIKQNEKGKLQLFIPSQADENKSSFFQYIKEAIQLTYKNSDYELKNDAQGISYDFELSHKTDLYALVSSIYLKWKNYENFPNYEQKDELYNGSIIKFFKDFCECRLSNSEETFYWCGNKRCFRSPIRYMLDNEWEEYTLLDFMRILNIPSNYVNKEGKETLFGYYIILSSFLNSFKELYEHLKCRECGNLMRPSNISNFASTAVTEFSCSNNNCIEKDKIIYINHCFICNSIIDSRDSKTCPNRQYICPKCGACCSTTAFERRINNLQQNGGYISDRLRMFVQKGLGHWEEKKFFCYKCGKQMTSNECRDCNIRYIKQ